MYHTNKSVFIKILALSATIMWQGALAGCTGNQQPLAWPDILKEIRNEFPDVRHLSTDELYSWLENSKRKSTILVDAREEEEFRISHISGAVNIPYKEDPLDYLKDIKPESIIVVYCSVGYRSSILVRKLRNMGFSEVYNLEGSIFKWANEGRPLVKEQTPVQKVHPYNSHWGKLLESKYHADVDTVTD